MPDNVELSLQYGRRIDLLVFGTEADIASTSPELAGLNLSEMRIKFSIKRTNDMTPNTADIRVYNLTEETVAKIKKEFKRVILQAGYDGNFGVIFNGTIKQVISGRESATDTFIDITAGDGDRAYNYAIMNTTLAAGASATDQLNAALQTMNEKGVTAGYIGEMQSEKLPRGKVFYGNTRDYVRTVTETNDQSWSIQDEKLVVVPLKSYLPNERVVLTSKTGLIGTPQQTIEGINIKCLLNPNIKVYGRVDIDEASVEQLKLDLNNVQNPANNPVPLSHDGAYMPIVIDYQGDTRGVEWYCNLVCVNIDLSTNARNAVQVGFG